MYISFKYLPNKFSNSYTQWGDKRVKCKFCFVSWSDEVVPFVLGSEFINQCPVPSAFLSRLCYRRIKPSTWKHITVSKECVMLCPKLQSVVSQNANCDCPTKPMYSCSCQNSTCQLYLYNPIIQYHPHSWLVFTHTITDRQQKRHHPNYEKAWAQSSDRSRYVSILLEIWYSNTCSVKCLFSFSQETISKSSWGKESAACWPWTALPR